MPGWYVNTTLTLALLSVAIGKCCALMLRHW
jgi:hypothetical protein